MDEDKRDNEQRTDQVLDSLLAAYSDVEPRPGMETRVLAGLRAAAGQQKSTQWSARWLWTLGGAVAILDVIFLVYLWQVSSLPQPSDAGVKAPPPAVQKVPSPEPVRRETAIRPKLYRQAPNQTHQVTLADVRQEVFPTPTPLSEQERLLLRYLAGTPHDEVASQSRPDERPEESGPDLPQTQQFRRTEVYDTR